MPKRSALNFLPDDLKEALHHRLIKNAFSGYTQLAEWLQDELDARDIELTISRQKVQLYGKKYQRTFEEEIECLKVATAQAKAISESIKDEGGDVNDILIRLTQERFYDALRQLGGIDLDQENISATDKLRFLNSMGKSIAMLGKAAVDQKKWAYDYAQKLEEAKAKAASEIDNLMGKNGLTPELAAQIRAQILGISVNG